MFRIPINQQLSRKKNNAINVTNENKKPKQKIKRREFMKEKWKNSHVSNSMNFQYTMVRHRYYNIICAAKM